MPTNKNNSVSLKDYLLGQGYAFPCGGKGLCGKCRILAPTYAITALDKRFLNDSDLARGIRLACDKEYSDAYKIVDCFLPKAPKPVKLIDPQIVALLAENRTVINIVEDGVLIDSAVFPPATADINQLYSVISKNAIEFYEKYGVAKAVTILIAGTTEKMAAFLNAKTFVPFSIGETFPADIYKMPSEEVYFPPIPGLDISNLAFLDIFERTDNTVLVYLNEKIASVIFKGETSILVTSLCQSQAIISDINDGIYSVNFKCLIATINYFMSENNCNKLEFFAEDIQAQSLKEMLSAYKLRGAVIPTQCEQVAMAALSQNKVKTKLNKLSSKVVSISVLDNDNWQNILATL